MTQSEFIWETPIDPCIKLYVVVRGDLSLGSQAVQGAHAVAEFVANMERNPTELYKSWDLSGVMIFVAVRNEDELLRLRDRAMFQGIDLALFAEPDLHGQFTAMCLLPKPSQQVLLSDLPLALGSKALRRDNHVKKRMGKFILTPKSGSVPLFSSVPW